MLSFILRRFVSAIPTLFLIITISFFLIRLAPGGPFDLERPLEAKVMENLNRIYKLDRPLLEQYLLYLGALARGDFGPSFILRDFSVAELFARGLPISMTLGALALARRDPCRRHARCHCGLPAEQRSRLPRHGPRRLRPDDPDLRDRAGAADRVRPDARAPAGRRLERRLPRNLILPVITLALPQIAVVARMTRAAMIENLRSNHIRTLRSLGLPHRVIVRHALRGAALPVVSYLGPGRGRAPDRLGRRRDDLRPAGHRPLLRRGGAEPRLHARDGHGGVGRRVRAGLQPDRRHPLRGYRPARPLRLR